MACYKLPPNKKNLDSLIYSSNPFVKKTKDSHHQFAHQHTSKAPVRIGIPTSQWAASHPRMETRPRSSRLPLLPKLIQQKSSKVVMDFCPSPKTNSSPKKNGWLEYQFPASLLGRFFGLFSGTKMLVSGRVFCWEMSFLKGAQPHPSHLLWRLQPKASIAAANNGNDNFQHRSLAKFF